ncbi:hypothetical protein GQ44DRAFT_676492 [Phaeosphaeriaceae sp. PMI808]|nr:hypothetical protein GQ44DRAFT_676492 [Phaeosphaeriaceae sp. PMI808]
MHFTAATLLAVLSGTVAVAAPTSNQKDSYNEDDTHKKEYEKDWANKWEGDEWKKNEKLFYFDTKYIVKATPDQVIAADGTPRPGQPDAKGIFKYGINIEENTICYNITLSGVTGDYESPALTATHIHEAVKGKAGPPRLAFPNPKGPDHRRVSYGCLTGPFTVGIKNAQGVDNGAAFHVKQIVANPSGFFTDSHTKQFLAGAVRGQLG